ncbi:hypothetical protein CDD81_5499 [Ophiocordyceps australis]|uniref:Ribosome biogenesis protein NOP53 n=1 Tax=Ophiocordyceps australis TaxID=1399860 RepID=A0A2C5Y9V0_9HYPO|nr:hypothetical protein CDD81_5499 [Ophiocordyceps australis]
MPLIQSLSGRPTDSPKQHNQPSRKGKKAWRKHVDVTEVEQGLQQLNEEIIRGGVIKEKPSSELFTIDLDGDSKIPQRFSKHIKKGLKADEIISQRSAVPAVSQRKRAADKTTNGLVTAKRLRTDWVSHKELSRLRKITHGHHESTVAIKDATFDLWDTTREPSSENPSEYLPNKCVAKVPKSMKQQPISLTASGKHVRAVQTPSGGYSYNPNFVDYEQRLIEECSKAVELEKKRLAKEEAERLKMEAAARSAAEAEAAEERANLSEWEEDSEWEGFQSGAEDSLRANQPKRKTQAQRNRIKRRKEEERIMTQKAALKIRRAQEQRIAELAQEVEEREQSKALVSAKQDDTEEEVTDDKLRRKQLGKFKLPEKDVELVLPDELQESLRLLKPEGNLLKDRYRSMLVRGKLESRRRIPFKRQAQKKLTEKWSYKDFVI